MRLRTFRKSTQKLLAIVLSPRLHWRWSRQIGRTPALSQSYKGQPTPDKRHRRTYLCQHWSIRQRLRVLVDHYRYLQVLPAPWVAQLHALQPTALAEVPLKSGDALTLFLEPSEFTKEGEIGLYLRDATGERLYSLSFSLGAEGVVLIGGLQGPRTSVDEGMVKWLGKEMFGLRPKNLLLSALYALVELMGSRQLLGIGDQAHPSSCKLKSSYDSFWLEAQGTPYDRHWFRLPIREPARDIAEVKSQRRSEFRRREALREALAQSIRQAWASAGTSDVAA